MRVGELCQKLDVPYRQIRYVLEQGIRPEDVEESPGRGEHCDLTPGQAFWLGVVLTLKRFGVAAPVAGRVADFAREGLRGVIHNLNWGLRFSPFEGGLETNHRWYVDLGGDRCVRVVTDADPCGGRQLTEFPWTDVKTRREEKHFVPVVMVRLDVARLAKMLL